MICFLTSICEFHNVHNTFVFKNGQTNNVTDNIHSIIAAAAVKFDPTQLESLFMLIQKVWLLYVWLLLLCVNI